MADPNLNLNGNPNPNGNQPLNLSGTLNDTNADASLNGARRPQGNPPPNVTPPNITPSFGGGNLNDINDPTLTDAERQRRFNIVLETNRDYLDRIRQQEAEVVTLSNELADADAERQQAEARASSFYKQLQSLQQAQGSAAAQTAGSSSAPSSATNLGTYTGQTPAPGPTRFGTNFSRFRSRGNIVIPPQATQRPPSTAIPLPNTGPGSSAAQPSANTPTGATPEQLNYLNYITSYLSRLGVNYTPPTRFNFVIPSDYDDIGNAVTTGSSISVDTLRVIGRYLGINNIDAYTATQLENVITGGQIAAFLRKNICGNTRFQDTSPISSDLAGRYKMQLLSILDSSRDSCFDQCLVPHLEVLGLERDENICTNLVPLCNFHMSYLFGLKLESISLNTILSLVNCANEDARNNTNILVLKAHEGFFQGRAYDIGPMDNSKFEIVLENNVKALQLENFNNPTALHDLTFIITILRIVSILMKYRDPTSFIRANIDDFVDSLIASPDAAEIFNVISCLVHWHKRINAIAKSNPNDYRSLLTYIVGEFSIQNRIQNISLDVNVNLNNGPLLTIQPDDVQIPTVVQPITQDDLIVVLGTVTFEMLRLRGNNGSDRILNYQEFKAPSIKCDKPPVRQTNPLIVSTNRATFK